MLTPEEKANDLLPQVSQPPAGMNIIQGLAWLDSRAQERLSLVGKIATAIRTAEREAWNAAVEECAVVARQWISRIPGHFMDDYEDGIMSDAVTNAAEAILEAIRAKKRG